MIEEVRAVTSPGLKDAKDLVDNAPRTLLEKVDKDKATEIAAKLTKMGAKVTVQPS